MYLTTAHMRVGAIDGIGREGMWTNLGSFHEVYVMRVGLGGECGIPLEEGVGDGAAGFYGGVWKEQCGCDRGGRVDGGMGE